MAWTRFGHMRKHQGRVLEGNVLDIWQCRETETRDRLTSLYLHIHHYYNTLLVCGFINNSTFKRVNFQLFNN